MDRCQSLDEGGCHALIVAVLRKALQDRRSRSTAIRADAENWVRSPMALHWADSLGVPDGFWPPKDV